MEDTKIFIIESLNDTDLLTGTNLYNDLLRYKLPLSSILYDGIIDRGDWNQTIDKIINNCQLGDIVFIHLEIHGREDGAGIVLHNGDFISFIDVCEDFRRINKKIGCNLFVSLAVCHGLFLITGMVPLQEMPFCGIIGSQETISESDLEIRFYEFYKCFLDYGNIDFAMQELENANPGLPSSYKYVKPDEIFFNAWEKYIENVKKEEWRKENAKIVAKQENLTRPQRRKFERDFEKKSTQYAARLFKEKSEQFFMLKDFPENRDRFYIPKTINNIPNN